MATIISIVKREKRDFVATAIVNGTEYSSDNNKKNGLPFKQKESAATALVELLVGKGVGDPAGYQVQMVESFTIPATTIPATVSAPAAATTATVPQNILGALVVGSAVQSGFDKDGFPLPVVETLPAGEDLPAIERNEVPAAKMSGHDNGWITPVSNRAGWVAMARAAINQMLSLGYKDGETGIYEFRKAVNELMHANGAVGAYDTTPAGDAFLRQTSEVLDPTVRIPEHKPEFRRRGRNSAGKNSAGAGKQANANTASANKPKSTDASLRYGLANQAGVLAFAAAKAGGKTDQEATKLRQQAFKWATVAQLREAGITSDTYLEKYGTGLDLSKVDAWWKGTRESVLAARTSYLARKAG